jgi:D-alanyl-D-alanine carboxypeptidase (penicillin-binding protein 5/6)
LFVNKKISLAIIISLLIFIVPFSLYGVELPLEAQSAILMDAHSGKILYEKEPHQKLFPASMTKLMTLVLAMEVIESGQIGLDDLVTVSEHAASYYGSHIFLAPDEKLTFYELLLGVAMASGNDASVAVAEYISGTHQAFVDLMNQKAGELGMKNTHFVNCNGLHDPQHYSTAYDFALLAKEALNYPLLLQMCSIKHYRIRTETNRPFQYDNKNKLLWFYPGTDGFKTGWTEKAQYCFVGTCQRDGFRLISVVMGVPVPRGHFAETKILYNYGFSQFSFREFYKAEEIVGWVKVGKGKVNEVAVIPVQRVGITLPRGDSTKIETQIEIMPLLPAPLEKGEKVGHISLVKAGEILMRTDLVVKESVAKGSLWQMFGKVLRGVFS